MASSGDRVGRANRASSPSRRDPGPLLGALPPPHGGLPESTREARGSGPLPQHHTQPPNPLARGPSWDETGQRKANRRQIVRGNSSVLRRATPPLPPPPPPRPARHKALHVYSPQLRYDGGGTKRILFSKVSLRFGGGSREKRKQGLPAPGIRVLTGWRGDRSAHSATPNSQLCGTLATGAGVRGPPARAPLVPGGATRGVSQRLRPRPGVSSAEPPTHIKQCLKARGRQIKTGVRVTHPHLSPPRG